MIELNLPASSDDVDAAAIALGCTIPEVMRRLYRRHDGFQRYQILEGGRTTASLNVFACARNHVRTRWLKDADDARDFQAMLQRGDSPLAIEHSEFREELEEHLGGVRDDLVAQVTEDHVCIATDWDGSVGQFYLIECREDAQTLMCLPKPRFMSSEGFIAAIEAPRRLTLLEFLAQVGAPTWLARAELYDEETVLMFHSRSADAAPGRGAGESLGSRTPAFDELAEIPGWRRALSNFECAPFELDGARWSTVEHYFQAHKFVDVDPEYRRRFCLDSGDALARGTGADARTAGGVRQHPLSPLEQVRWEARKFEVMQRALDAKYEQNAEHRRILLATHDAMLTHKPARARYARVEYELMCVRARLCSEP